MKKILFIIITIIIISTLIYKTNYENIVSSFIDNKNYKIAFFIAQKTNIENPQLNYKISLLALQGNENFSKDIKLAEYFMQRAGRKGNVEAMANLAERYFSGNEFVQNDSLAFYWSYKAAQQGNKLAANIVGTLFCEGRGVNKDIEYGKYWLEKSGGL